jgi:N-dimethylarginine dimethylaminohydrolase
MGLHADLYRIAQTRGDDPANSGKGLPKETQTGSPSAASRPRNPSQVEMPAFMMCFPFSLSIDNPNNIWMEELDDEDKELDYEKAYTQVTDLINYMGSSALLYILPSYGDFQDLIYVANIGIYLPHIKSRDTIIVSNFRSDPRRGEERVGTAFFKLMGYKVYQSPSFWEGEADLKYLKDNIYLGGYGIRTELDSYTWMTDNFDMSIIPIEMTDEYLYHFDCLCAVANKDSILLVTDTIKSRQLKKIEKLAEVVSVPKDLAYNGATNTVRLYESVLCASSIGSLDRKDSRYSDEKKKMDFLTDVYGKLGMDVSAFNLTEIEKSGAQLSCLVFHFNYIDQGEDNI